MIKQISILLLMVILAGCGTRRVATQSEKAKIEQKGETKTEIKSEIKSDVTESKEESNTSEIKNDVVTVENVKVYDGKGGLLEDRSKTITDRTTQRSSSNVKWLKRSVITQVLDIRITTYKLQIITTKSKTKNVDADKSFVGNLGGKVGLILMGLLVVGVMIAYWFVRRKFK